MYKLDNLNIIVSVFLDPLRNCSFFRATLVSLQGRIGPRFDRVFAPMEKLISSKSFRSSRLQIACRAFNAGALKRFRKDTCGSAMIYIGLSLPVLLGFSGMAVDGSIWFANKRSMQASADAAAFSAALEMTRINDDGLAKSRAQSDAEENHYDPSSGDTIEINSPPKYGPYSGNNAAFEAIVSRPSPSAMSGSSVSTQGVPPGLATMATARAVTVICSPWMIRDRNDGEGRDTIASNAALFPE